MKKRKYEYSLERYLVATDDGEWEFVFGKHVGELLSLVARHDSRYLSWMLSKDFPDVVLTLVADALEFRS